MSSQINVRPEDLVRLADRCIDWAMDLTGASADSAGAPEVAPRDAGNTQGGYGTISMRSDVDEVRFCLGVVSPPFPESMTPRTEEEGTRTVGHASADQHLFCSKPEEL